MNEREEAGDGEDQIMVETGGLKTSPRWTEIGATHTNG